MKQHRGIGIVTVVIVLVVVVAIAGLGTYVFVFAAPRSPGTDTTTVTLGTTLSTGGTRTETESTHSATSGTQINQTYSGTFSYTVPLGPSGVNDSSGKPVQWNSTQTASGSFKFSINPVTYIGTGSGQGSITVNTQGYCTGSSTVQYTFTIEAINLPETQNVSIDFNLPDPSTVMVKLTCEGSTAGFYTANNPVTYLSVYPNGLDLNFFPAKVSQVLKGGISYSYDITEIS